MLEKIIIPRSDDNPQIVLDAENSTFEISGVCNICEVGELSNKVLAWLDEYAKQPNPQTNFVFKMDYFNVPASKVLLDIMSKLEHIKENGSDVKISWLYHPENPDMMEAGDEYEEMVEIPFEKICVN